MGNHTPTRTRHAQVPRWVHERVTDPIALMVYTHTRGEYGSKTSDAFPHETTLATSLGYCERTIRRALHDLQAAGALAIQRTRKHNRYWGHNTYWFPTDDPLANHGERDAMETPFAMVPRWVYQRVASATALRVYVHLADRYCDADRACFPPEAQLVAELGIAPRTVQLALKALRDADAIISAQARHVDGDWGRNHHALPLDDPRETATFPETTQNGQNGPQPDAGVGPHSPAGQYLYPPKQLDPHSCKDRAAAAAPSTPCVEDAKGNSLDQEFRARVRDLIASVAGVKTSPERSRDQERVGSAATTPVDLHESSSPADLEPGECTGRPDCACVGCSTDWDRLESWLTAVSDRVGGLEAWEEQCAAAMLARGDHYLKVTNTIMKQRRVGYPCAA